jgi:prepilin-type N-terminal cleavage/methylation domain-containing protein
MPRQSTLCRSRRGYTLVEVLLVVTILGIVSAMVVPSMLTAGSMGVQAAARIIVADLLYAQNEAVAQQANRSVTFDLANNRYQLTDETGTVLTESWISGTAENYVVDFSRDSRFQGVSLLEVDFDGGNTIAFDDLGGPSTGGSVTLQYQRQKYRIDVASFTGRITVTKL